MLTRPLPYAQALATVSPASAQNSREPQGQEALSHRLRLQLAGILQAPADEIDANARFTELGLDSLTGLKFLDGINRELGLSLGAEVLYDHSSLADLVGFLVRQASVQSPATESPRSGTVEAVEVRDVRPSQVTAQDVAVIGISVRFAGAANAAQFWQNLAEGRDTTTEVPEERWSAAQHFSPDRDQSDKTYGKWGGFLRDHDRFDPLFFNISPREAEYMDPQQRLFLEECWKALEDAGYAERQLAGLRCGVYAGVIGNEYDEMVRRNGRAPDAYQLLGNSASILAARIAYLLNLKGPTLSIDTACSSSLVAVDLACQAMHRGEIDLALAGGVTLYLSERPFVFMSRAGMLAADGKCKTFDRRADGVVPGEGVGVVVLKPLGQALRDRDFIYGIIKASGTNQDGRTNGITAPSAASQTALIQEVHRRAGVSPGTITFVEAHGTGTSLGDPIEVTALTQAFQPEATQPDTCAWELSRPTSGIPRRRLA